MRKLWLILALLTAFTVAAVSAQAASVPTRMNGSSWNYTAFQLKTPLDATTSVDPQVAYGTMLNSTYNSTGDGSLVGKLSSTNTAATATTFTVDGGTNATVWRAGQSFGRVGGSNPTRTNSTSDLLALEFVNGTSALYFINNPAQTLFASITPEVLAGTPAAGVNLGLMVQNVTITNNSSDVAGTWYFYSLDAFNGSNVYANLGSMVLTSTGAAGAMSYATINNNGTANATHTDTATWGVTDGNTAISINGTTLGVICDKAFLSRDKKIMIGIDAPTAAGNLRTVVALKSGTTFSSSTFTNAGFNSLAIASTNNTGNGNAKNANVSANGTLQSFYTDSDRDIFTGNYTAFTHNGTQKVDSLIGKALTLGTTTLGGVTQSTMALTGSSTFVGRTVSDVYAGIIYNAAAGTVGLQIMVPAPTQVSAPVAASADEITTFNSSFSVKNAGGTSVSVVAGTVQAVESVALQGGENLGTLASQFENATDTAIATQYNLGSATLDRNFPVSSFAVTAVGAGNMTVRKISFAGNNKLISELPIPTKFYVAAVTTAAGTTHAANSTRAFNYRSAGTAITDGSYWITPSGFPTLTLNYNDANRLALGSNYDMWLAILDDGDYDLNPTDGAIADPSGFLSGVGGGGGGIGSSSSSDGCVLNPAAGFSVEMLLLLLAPLAYFIRRKK